MITILYTSIDRCREKRKFKTMQGAQRFAHRLIGEHPEMGFRYAISGDGVGKIQVEGATLNDIFPEKDSGVSRCSCSEYQLDQVGCDCGACR